MIAAILVEGITDDGSRATVDAENYSGSREPKAATPRGAELPQRRDLTGTGPN